MRSTTSRPVVGYIRVSTEEQAREGVSLQAQEESIRAMAVSQNWEIAEVYCDQFTGTTLKRPSFIRLVQDIEDGRVGMVLVYKLDRLGRSQRLILQILDDVFEANDVTFKSVTEPFETSSAMGKAFLGMLAVFAQLERDTISERTKHALIHKKNQGKHCGRVPYGFQLDADKRLERDPEQQRTIAKIKRLRREGCSIRVIARRTCMPISTVFDLANDHGTSRNSRYLNRMRVESVR